MGFLLALTWALEHHIAARATGSAGSLLGLLSWRGSVVGLVGALAVIIPIWIWPQGPGTPASAPTPPPVPERYALAVLPILPTDTTDSGLTSLADHLTTLLIDHIDSFKRLEVRPQREVWQYRDPNTPLSEISRRLGVRHLITGGVERSGSGIRLSLELSDSLRRLWSESFILREGEVDGDLSPLESVLPRLTESLRSTLGTDVSAREVRLGSQDAEAVRLVLEGRVQKASGSLPGRAGGFEAAQWLLSQADSLFREASRLDPDWAEPHLQRADVSELRSSVGYLAEVFGRPGSLSAEERREVIEEGIRHVNRALELNRGDSRAFEMRGVLHLALAGLGDPEDALEGAELEELARQDFQRSIAADPYNPVAHAKLSLLHFGWGDFAEARTEAEAAYEQNVFMEELPTLLSNLAISNFELGDDEEAMRRCREGLDRYGDAQARVVFVECELTLLAFAETLTPDAERAWELLLSEDGEIRPENREPRTGGLSRSLGMLLSAVLAREGLADSARVVMEQVRGAPSNLKNRVTEAAVLTELGDTLPAMEILEECLRQSGQSPRVLLGTRKLRPLWDYPGFSALASDAGVVLGGG
jgi:TolB-like protein/tetratricopeptide (TPR) repeat protein